MCKNSDALPVKASFGMEFFSGEFEGLLFLHFTDVMGCLIEGKDDPPVPEESFAFLHKT